MNNTCADCLKTRRTILFREPLRELFFKSTEIDILSAVNSIKDKHVNYIDNMFISLNEWYREIGLPDTELGDFLEWHVNELYVTTSDTYDGKRYGVPYKTIYYDRPPQFLIQD